MGHNLGWGVVFPGQARLRDEWVEADGGPEAVADHIQGLDLLHDTFPNSWLMKGVKDQACKRAIDAVKKHMWSHWIYQFTPYWKQDIVKLPREDMYASFYIARPSVLAATRPDESHHRMTTIKSYVKMYRYLPLHIQARIPEHIERERALLGCLKDKAIMIVYNHSDWEGVMRLKPDWKKLGLGEPTTLTAENAVHSTGFRIEKTKDKDGKEVEKAVFFDRPEEYAKIENGEIIFPMTKFNYRMIVIQKGE
jgi:hypothetical protein